VDKFYSGKLQSLCKRCHDGVKQRLEKGARFVGCDVNGRPLAEMLRQSDEEQASLGLISNGRMSVLTRG